jgi:hypothetical protein
VAAARQMVAGILKRNSIRPLPMERSKQKNGGLSAKGRAGTVEPDEVKSAVNNALAIDGLDYLVIATNTQFSNPTRDWVKKWQAKHSKPKVKLGITLSLSGISRAIRTLSFGYFRKH